MRHLPIAAALVLSACAGQYSGHASAVCEDDAGPDAPGANPPDAAIDASIDAPPPELSLLPWPRHTILAPDLTPSVSRKGADGVKPAIIGGKLAFSVGWEQGNQSTVSIHPGCGDVDMDGIPDVEEQWPFVRLPKTTTGVEDAHLGDVNMDGRPDVVSSGASGFRLTVHIGPTDPNDALTPSAWVGGAITTSINELRFINSVVGDLDGDGLAEIVTGGYGTTTANPTISKIQLYTSADPTHQNAAGDFDQWSAARDLADVTTVYSLELRDPDADGDLDIMYTDKVGSFRGLHYLENPLVPSGSISGTWANRHVYKQPANGMRWADFSSDGRTVLIVTSCDPSPSVPTCTPALNTVHILTCGGSSCSAAIPTGGTLSSDWTKVDLPAPTTNSGYLNAGRLVDLDGDGDLDVSLVSHHADGTLKSAMLLRNEGGGTYVQGDVSGDDGTKIDIFWVGDLDCDLDVDWVFTDEGKRGEPTVDQLGVGYYENELN